MIHPYNLVLLRNESNQFQLNEEPYMSVHLDDLCKDYHEGRVVPFIGAGLSIPFNVPDWGDLIREIAEKYAVGDLSFVKSAVEQDLQRYNYWQAIDALKNYTTVQEEDIQEYIAVTVQKKIKKVENDLLHNYSDLKEMDFKLFLTTNYENILHNYLQCELNPILLKELQFNTQGLFDQKESANYTVQLLTTEQLLSVRKVIEIYITIRNMRMF